MTTPTANISPIWTAAPSTGTVVITQSSANVNSSAPGTIGTGCFLAFSTGTDGSFLQRVRFTFTSTTGQISSVATTLQVYLSTVSSGATSSTDTFLLASAQAAAQTISAVTTSSYVIDVPLNIGVQASRFILVAQSVAQNANANWKATVLAGNY